MHLLEALAAGVRGAEDGTVDIYSRGTTTRATYYTGFDGSGATTPTGSITLDSNGGAVLYVNEEVDLVVKTNGGATLRSFTSSPAASAMELRSQSFTGVHYDTGASAASNPIDMQSVMDLWKTNAGSVDWKVLVGGVATTLQEAFSVVGAAFVNVKAEVYGAVGDGTTNDTAAIQAAIDAAENAGGGTVFFPAGTYRTTTALTIPAGVSIQGTGAASRIQCDTAAGIHILTFEADANATSVSNIRLGHSQASTGRAINLAGVARILRVDNCVLGDGFTGGGCIYLDTADTLVTATNCVFEMNALNGTAVKQGGGNVAAIANVIGCRVNYNGARSTGFAFFGAALVLGCVIDGSGMTSGTETVHTGGGTATVEASIGNTITNPTGGTLDFWGDGAKAGNVFECGNFLGSSVAYGSATSTAAQSTYHTAHTLYRDRNRFYVASDAAAITIDQGEYGLVEIERSNTDVQTVTFQATSTLYQPSNCDFLLVYNNTGHGSGTGTITLSGVKGITTFTVNANRYSVYFFKCVHVNATAAWVMVDSAENLA